VEKVVVKVLEVVVMVAEVAMEKEEMGSVEVGVMVLEVKDLEAVNQVEMMGLVEVGMAQVEVVEKVREVIEELVE
jgi:hypothetical protein